MTQDNNEKPAHKACRKRLDELLIKQGQTNHIDRKIRQNKLKRLERFDHRATMDFEEE